jgi:eukaryotic-like serine/threonine-protein kinase
LERAGVAPPAGRRRLLIELICVDMEYRWRNAACNRLAHEPIMLEGYTGKFPELGTLEQVPLELIGEEYRVRRIWGDRPGHLEFLSQFDARQEEIRAHLLQIDSELEGESVDPRPIVLSRAEPLPLLAQAEQILDGPLLSHHDVLLQRMIGAGQMGKVYQARFTIENRTVAVKFLRKAFLHQPGVVERFIGEARTIAKLDHPCIVAIRGLGRTPGGAYFIVMDLVDGPNLDEIVRTKIITANEAVTWAIQTCLALDHAHTKGIIHCDLKPANLLLAQDGSIRVTDFGLARSLTEHTPCTAEVEGTAPFMAPEQALRCWGEIDARTDVYGIGAVLFTLLTGRAPWVGRRLPDILANVISAAPVIAPIRLRPELPEALSDLCGKCLSKAPKDRYPTVRDLRLALIGMIGSL